ncbi:sugar ABC transporter ATP-binding protein [Lachnospiraceae bacterium 64-25]|nr:ribose import ATP-binding protein RbsA [Lachnospiraceae bacterium]
MGTAAIEVRNLDKRYGGVHALKSINLSFEKGKVCALLGENGAGKSTLIKILSGIEQPTGGEILIDGKEIKISNPLTAQHYGISTVHQEPMQVMAISVAENIYAGRLPKNKLGMVDYRKLRRQTSELMEKINIRLDPDQLLSELSIAQRQLVEILKAISYDAKVVIFDEPTSSLTKEETKTLYEIIRMLHERGITIIYVSHRMKEIYDLCQEAAVLRDGRNVFEGRIDKISQEELIRNMVGRNMGQLYPKIEIQPGKKVLEVKNLTSDYVKDVSFSLREGEILGLSGLVGAGRTEVARALFGIDSYKGEMILDQKAIHISSPDEAISKGIVLVPEDRKSQGLVRILDIRKNIGAVDMRYHHKWGFLMQRDEEKTVSDLIERLNVKTPSAYQIVDNLSGGNQQKVVFAKWLTKTPRVLILDEPTRGIDVGAKAEIYSIIGELVRGGIGIIMISSEMPELIAMSDRILVMREGTCAGIVDRSDFSEHTLINLALKGGTA